MDKKMTEKPITKRMQALTNLAHYSKRIQITIDNELVNGDFKDISTVIQESIDCLMKDGRNTMIVTCDDIDTGIDIMVKV